MRKLFFSILLTFLILILSSTYVSAHSSHPEHDSFEQAEATINAEIPCDKLSEDQLEMIGDYYMEKMHPGEAHELMDDMMGGENSSTLKQMHIQMAKRLYCNDDSSATMGMMGGSMMNMMMGNNMMGSGMIGEYPTYYGYNNFWNILWLVFLIGAIALIVLLIYKFTKSGKESETPISILQKRYAKGEISKKQFEEMKKELKE